MDGFRETTLDVGGNRRIHTITAGKVDPKNVHGDLGPRCAYCSGLGFTNSIEGGSHSCKRCDATGVEPSKAIAGEHLQKQIDDLRDIVLELVQEIKKNG